MRSLRVPPRSIGEPNPTAADLRYEREATDLHRAVLDALLDAGVDEDLAERHTDEIVDAQTERFEP